MIGQVAALRDEVTTIAELHADVSARGAPSSSRRDDVGARRTSATPSRRPARLDVAIVGMAALLPGAPDTEQFWSNVLAGVDAVREVPAERWDIERYYDPNAVTGRRRAQDPLQVGRVPRARSAFDPLAYGIPPRSLASIEPVQLLALEVAKRALARCRLRRRASSIARAASVIFGAEAGTDLSAAYGLPRDAAAYLAPGNGHGPLPPELEEHLPELTEDSFPGVLTNVIAGRIANRLDLGGVNYTVDAACAASLAALDLAVQGAGVGHQRHRAVRRRRPPQQHQRLPDVLERARAVADRPVPHVRRVGRRHRARRRRRVHRARSGSPTPSATAIASTR